MVRAGNRFGFRFQNAQVGFRQLLIAHFQGWATGSNESWEKRYGTVIEGLNWGIHLFFANQWELAYNYTPTQHIYPSNSATPDPTATIVLADCHAFSGIAFSHANSPTHGVMPQISPPLHQISPSSLTCCRQRISGPTSWLYPWHQWPVRVFGLWSARRSCTVARCAKATACLTASSHLLLARPSTHSSRSTSSRIPPASITTPLRHELPILWCSLIMAPHPTRLSSCCPAIEHLYTPATSTQSIPVQHSLLVSAPYWSRIYCLFLLLMEKTEWMDIVLSSKMITGTWSHAWQTKHVTCRSSLLMDTRK